MLRIVTIAVAAGFVGGCATFAPGPSNSGAEAGDDRAGSAAAPAPNPRTPRAATSLLEQSRAERAAGRYEEAGVAIERALAIAPNDPTLWLELAELRLEEGEPAQAEVMARKALTLAAGDAAVERRAMRLLD